MNYRKATLGLSLLVGVLGIVVWNMRPEKDQKQADSSRSDYRLVDFTMMAFNEDGQESFSLSSPLLERDPLGKSLAISKPAFAFPNDTGEVWRATSESAWVSDKAREIELRQQVRIIGPVSPQGLQTEFSTEKLTVYPKQNRIHGDDWVTISHGTSILKGLGLEADLKQHRVQLLAKVQAHYAPKDR
jgi:lipopolysaccharide export system protein LptC